MLDSYLVKLLTSIRRLDTDVTLDEPLVVSFSEEDETKVALMNKTGRYQIYDRLGLKPKLSQDLHKEDPEIWQTLIDKKKSNLDNTPLILFRDSVIGVYGTSVDNDFGDLEENVTKFIEALNNLSEDTNNSTNFVEYTLDQAGCLKIKIQSYTSKEYSVIVILTLDLRNGYYAVHSGVCTSDGEILLYNTPLFGTPLVEEFFARYSEIGTEIVNQKRLIEGNLVSVYDMTNTMSVGEVLWALKCMGADVSTDDAGACMSISAMNVDSSTKIVEYLNAFNMPFKSLKKLQHLRKSLRNTHMTIGEMLAVMNKDFLNPDLTVSAWTMADLGKITRGSGDQSIIRSELSK